VSGRIFNESIEPCPWLPAVGRVMTAQETRQAADGYGAAFYLAALRFAQSLWREGKPAQAILQLNKAWMAELRGGEPVLADWPPPFRALDWILRHARDDHFLGNPVRHFQHLATRIAGPRPAPRAWRAWACFHLAEQTLPPARFPRDLAQVAREQVEIPPVAAVLEALHRLGWPGEAGLAAELLLTNNADAPDPMDGGSGIAGIPLTGSHRASAMPGANGRPA
jgi:hypothetical protein